MKNCFFWRVTKLNITKEDFFFGRGAGRGSKITADGDCSHELKDAYFLEEKL